MRDGGELEGDGHHEDANEHRRADTKLGDEDVSKGPGREAEAHRGTADEANFEQAHVEEARVRPGRVGVLVDAPYIPCAQRQR